jgi:D-3-phosphoglycerate dehydrogenase / 2-oxoglutarate reductase
MSAARVLITCLQMQDVYEHFRHRFEERDIDVELAAVDGQQLSEAQLAAMIGQFDGIIAGDDPLTAHVLSRADRLRTIAKWGVGIDAIDVDAARARGIVVTNTPGTFGDDVADLAIGYLVTLTRQIHRIHASVAAGGWLKVRGTRLAGKTVGVIGAGSIGQAVVHRLPGFGVEVLAHDVDPAALRAATALGATAASLDALLAASHAVVLCCPLTPETHHLIDAAALATLPHGALLVNVSRGALVDEPALVDALASGQVAAAALDVFEAEPLPADSPLRRFEQCVFGSHNGSNTTEGVLQCSAMAVGNLLAGLGIA